MMPVTPVPPSYQHLLYPVTLYPYNLIFIWTCDFQSRMDKAKKVKAKLTKVEPPLPPKLGQQLSKQFTNKPFTPERLRTHQIDTTN